MGGGPIVRLSKVVVASFVSYVVAHVVFQARASASYALVSYSSTLFTLYVLYRPGNLYVPKVLAMVEVLCYFPS